MAKFRKIGILTSGGDAPGMNAAIRAVARKAINEGIEVVGILEGYNGLINGNLRPLDNRAVSNIITTSGTILYTSRCPEFKTEEGMAKAIKTCEENHIDAVIAIGGDGTFRGATDLTNHGIPSIGIPGTIDNDITATEYTIGFDTAMNTVIQMVDAFRQTCESHARCNIIEVMGRDCGMIALYAGVASGAVAIAIPEFEFDEEYAISKFREAREHGKRGMIGVFAEGVSLDNTKKYSEEFVGKLQSETGIETRFARLGHVVRGGNPTLRDRLGATQMGAEAVSCLLDGKSNVVVGVKNGLITDIDINYALVLDRMYKGKLKDGDLDKFTAAQIEEMKETCARRRNKMEKLYRLSFELSK
ncbi:MAG: ATP-dependent 6-phosphofructokinase [Eubacteriales bacterium]